MNVVNIASVLNSRPRRRGAGRPGDFLRDLNTMLGRWESMTPSECTRVTGMYVALCRKTQLINDYLANWHSHAAFADSGMDYPQVWKEVACPRLLGIVEALRAHWDQQREQTAVTPVLSLKTVHEVTAVMEHYGSLNRTIEQLEGAAARLRAFLGMPPDLRTPGEKKPGPEELVSEELVSEEPGPEVPGPEESDEEEPGAEEEQPGPEESDEEQPRPAPGAADLAAESKVDQFGLPER